MDFLNNNKRFSFKLDGINAWDLPYEVSVSSDGLTTVYTFQNGLKIKNIAKKYDDFGAYEWVNWLENTSSVPTGIISELWDCNVCLPMKHEDEKKWSAFILDRESSTKLYAPKGSDYTRDEFWCDVDLFERAHRQSYISPEPIKYPAGYGYTKTFTSDGGRSGAGQAPFFKIHKEDMGYIFAVGWTGQWQAEITRHEDAVTFKSKIEDTNFRLLPGEKIRTSSVVILPYQGDAIDGQNKWRRFIKTKISVLGQPGRETQAPFCAGVWGGLESKQVVDRVNILKEKNIPVEYIWMDAGWYGEANPSPDEFADDWWRHTGNWKVSKKIHPGGLKDVAKAIHDAGLKFILWFEPERVVRTTPIVMEHPEYFLFPETDALHCLLDLGNPEAWQYCYETLSDRIEEIGVDCYRQDFNFPPLPFWRKKDTAGRKGMTEIKHIMGLYALWDALLEKFPHLWIDNCASGGNRIDIETLRRSVPLWRSDYQCPADVEVEYTQCHHLAYGSWMPFSGTGPGRNPDLYRLRSSYAPGLTTNFTFSANTPFETDEALHEFMKKIGEEFLQVRPYLSEDMYPLTDHSVNYDVWCAFQYNRPAQQDGLIQAFRRAESPYETAVFHLRGLNPEKNYRFTDLDGGTFTLSGKDLSEKGLSLTLPEKRSAKIYIYKEI